MKKSTAGENKLDPDRKYFSRFLYEVDGLKWGNQYNRREKKFGRQTIY
jgi:hypothetical protein